MINFDKYIASEKKTVKTLPSNCPPPPPYSSKGLGIFEKLKAFTLVETLITLTIIGVIAALTIPNLAKKWSDHADVIRVKEAYSILSNAYKLCISENGTMETWDWDGIVLPAWIPYNHNKLNALTECMLPYLKVQKYCGSQTGCMPISTAYDGWGKTYMTLAGQTGQWGTWTDTYRGKVRLQNGMNMSYSSIFLKPNSDGDVYVRVDINGDKKPNRYGYDVFFFRLTRNGVTVDNYTERCNKEANISNKATSGQSCAYWVMHKGNMDYKYRDVSAEW